MTELLYYMCELCGNGYERADTLEFHLKKEHTKLDFVAYLKKKAVRKTIDRNCLT